MVQAVNNQGASRSGSWGADLASHAVKCFCAGAKVPEGTFWKAEEQTVECTTTAARKHSSGSSLLRDLLGSKERTPAVVSSDRCFTSAEAKGSQAKGLRGPTGAGEARRRPPSGQRPCGQRTGHRGTVSVLTTALTSGVLFLLVVRCQEAGPED